MRRFISVWILILATVYCCDQAIAAGCTDVCGGRNRNFNECGSLPRTVTGTYNTVITGDTGLLTSEYFTSGDRCDVGSVARDFSLRFSPEFSALFTIDTDGSAYDTTLSILDCDTGSILKCDDDSGAGTASAIQVRLEQFKVYAIIVDGFSRTNQGLFNLRLVSVVWPPETDCPGIDRIASLPSVERMNESPMKLYTGSTERASQRLNLTECSDNETVTGTVDYGFLTPADVVGVVVSQPGNYSFLACPKAAASRFPPVAFRPILCRNDSSEACPQPQSTLSLVAGNFVSLVVTEQNLTAKVGVPYTVYGSINQSEFSSWCSVCRSPMHDFTESLVSFPRLFYSPKNVTLPDTNETILGDILFLNHAGVDYSTFGVCGPINAFVRVRDCSGEILAESRAGTYFQLRNFVTNRLYAVEVAALSPDDVGTFTAGQVRDNWCNQEKFGEGFDEKISACTDAETGVYVFAFTIYLVLALASAVTGYASSTFKDFKRSGAFTMLILCSLGSIPSLYFLIECQNPSGVRIRDFLVFWITWSVLSTAILLYQVVANDWTLVFGDALFFRDDESIVKIRFVVAIIGICALFSSTICGFVFLGSIDGLRPSFEFCTFRGEECLGVEFGTIIQKVLAVRTFATGPNGEIVFENWNQEVVYEAVRELDAQTFYCGEGSGPMFAAEDTVAICRDTCRLHDGPVLFNNGICDDNSSPECGLGTDCTDCGPRFHNVTRRLLRCNKSNTLVEFWGNSKGFVNLIALPFVYSFLSFTGAMVVAIWTAMRRPGRSSSPSLSSESNCSFDEEDEENRNVVIANNPLFEPGPEEQNENHHDNDEENLNVVGVMFHPPRVEDGFVPQQNEVRIDDRLHDPEEGRNVIEVDVVDDSQVERRRLSTPPQRNEARFDDDPEEGRNVIELDVVDGSQVERRFAAPAQRDEVRLDVVGGSQVERRLSAAPPQRNETRVDDYEEPGANQQVVIVVPINE